jgi:hypothetical protein
VGDLSFGTLLPADEDDPLSEPPRTTPNTSAKRRRLGNTSPHATVPTRSDRQQSKKKDPYDLTGRSEASRASITASPARQRSVRTRATELTATQVTEEVEESPADAPGSGQRRTVNVNSASKQTARLTNALRASNAGPSQDSPLVRKRAASIAASIAASQTSNTRPGIFRQTRTALEEDEDELSPAVVDFASAPSSSSPAVRAAAKVTQANEYAQKQKRARKSSRLSRAIEEQGDELSPAPLPDLSEVVASSSPLTRRAEKNLETQLSAPQTVESRKTVRISGEGLDVDELSPQFQNTSRITIQREPQSIPARRRQEVEEADKLSPVQTSRKSTAKAERARGRPPVPLSKVRRESAAVTQNGAEPDELSPEAPSRPRRVASNLSRSSKKQSRKAVEVEREAPPTEEEASAEEIEDEEAARQIGKKRPRRSLKEPSLSRTSEEPVRKRRRKEVNTSPAKQKQPRPQKNKAKPANLKEPNEKASESRGDLSTRFSVMVQRFAQHLTVEESSDSTAVDADILSAETMRFANRKGVNVVDVLAQVVSETVANTLDKLKGFMRDAEDPATKRELKTQAAAVRMFGTELATRLLEHVRPN